MDTVFKDKRVAVLGLAVEGQDICRYLLSKGADITVFDRKKPQELEKINCRIRNKVRFSLGQNYLKLLTSEPFDYIARSPGFRPDLPEIRAALAAGAVLTSATKLFFEKYPGNIIGITGTKGKGTTSTLIYEILKESGKKVFLAGNIGKPVLKDLESARKNDWAVLELSSFQLMDFDRSPHIAVVLMIVPEHQDYHLSTVEYISAKENLVKFQGKSDFSVLNHDNLISRRFSTFTRGRVKYFSRKKKVNGAYSVGGKIYWKDHLVGKTKDLKLRGEHNHENVCAAVTAAGLAGAGIDSIRKIVFRFKGLEHRLEPVRTWRGISFFNDSFSTTPETAIAAVKSFSEPIVLIAGGSEKGSDFHSLGQEISRSTVKTLILIGQMAEKIQEAVLRSGFQGKIIFRPQNMKEIVKKAVTEATYGDIVLLSPACASFDLFLNYKDRGQQFKKHVKALAKT